MAVLISHRFPTVRMADRVYAIEDSQVSEHGTHEEVIALNGPTPPGSACGRPPIDREQYS